MFDPVRPQSHLALKSWRKERFQAEQRRRAAAQAEPERALKSWLDRTGLANRYGIQATVADAQAKLEEHKQRLATLRAAEAEYQSEVGGTVEPRNEFRQAIRDHEIAIAQIMIGLAEDKYPLRRDKLDIARLERMREIEKERQSAL